MKILWVEDEVQAGSHLRRGLVENGFAVDVASRHGAVAMARRARYDLLILDVKPCVRLSSLLSIGGEAPVLLLTEPNSPIEELGPYPPAPCLLKPFGFSEFLTQVRRMLPWASAGNPLIARI